AVLAQPGELIVYSSSSEDSFPRSRIDADVAERVGQVDGIGEQGGLGMVQLGARAPGRGERDLLDVVVIGSELGLPSTGGDGPDAPGPGEGVADATLRAEGLDVGDTIEVGPARTPVRIVGFLDDELEYSGQGTVWTDLDTWRGAINENRPSAGVGDDVVQALVIDPGPSDVELDQLARDIDDATQGATSTLTLDEAANAIGGVEQQRSTFNQIIGVTVLIAVVVVALFFVLLTVERTAMYGVLKAIGARTRTLIAGVVLQAVVVTLIACAIGAALGLALDAVVPVGSIPFTLGVGRIVSSVVLLLVAACLGSAFSLRRVLKIDPAEAIGRGS
ncbi:MAG: ABC transporter permease, partial [Microthrixaceae bacterium]